MSNALERTSLSSFNSTFIIISVMLVAIIEVLDMTIVNVALPQMMGQLGANTDQITWVLTSYVVSSAILMPMTGFLVSRIGQRRLLLINVIGFMFSSALCGASNDLTSMVVFRTLQGVFGASLVPISQTVLRDTFPIEKQAKAMTIWGIGIMVAPVLGPTIGGYITAIASWRWVFYLNVPVCLLAAFMILRFIRETDRQKVPIDWTGVILMTVGIACLQVFLDRGNTLNWFDSQEIIILMLVAFFSLGMFITRGLRVKEKNIIDFTIFKDRNFSCCTVMLAIFCMGALGIFTLRPIMMEHLIGYTAETAGLSMAPSGLASAVGMMIGGTLLNRIHPKIILIAGILITCFGSYLMARDATLQLSLTIITWQNTIPGFGMGLVFLVVSTVALSTLRGKKIAEGAGLFSFGRNLGISVGVSLLSTLVTRETQVNWATLSSHTAPGNPNLTHWLMAHHANINDVHTIAQLTHLIASQSSLIAFMDAFWITTIGFLFLLPLALLIKPPKELSMNAGH